jgi:uncharacterized FlgJ-related protein
MILSFSVFKLIKTVEYVSEETKLVIIKEQNEFSREKLIEYLLLLNVRYPDIALAQAEIESANFTSKIFKESNNLFGMKQSRRRPSTALGEEFGHAYYSTWKESVLDYALYNATFLSKVNTQEEYLQYLRQNYAEDPNYINKLLEKLKK